MPSGWTRQGTVCWTMSRWVHVLSLLRSGRRWCIGWSGTRVTWRAGFCSRGRGPLWSWRRCGESIVPFSIEARGVWGPSHGGLVWPCEHWGAVRVDCDNDPLHYRTYACTGTHTPCHRRIYGVALLCIIGRPNSTNVMCPDVVGRDSWERGTHGVVK